MKKVLVLAPKHYIDELGHYYYNPKFKIHFADSDRVFKLGLKEYLIKAGKVSPYDGYIGLADDAVQVAAILARKFNRPGPSIQGLLNCQNKLISRGIQQTTVPEMAVSYFEAQAYRRGEITHPKLPLFVKPIRASMSTFAFEVNSEEQLKGLIASYNPREYARTNNFSQIYALGLIKHPLLKTYGDLICEEYIDYGIQVTLDGYASGGNIGWFGFTKSVFLPNRISFKRFDFPFEMDTTLRAKILHAMAKLIGASELDNTLFNIELKIDLENEKVKIIEINPRPSTQFMYPIQLVSGTHPLDVALDIAVGESKINFVPAENNLACSVCLLRRDTDARVAAMPDAAAVEALEKKYPGLRVNYLAWPGDKLSDYPQDSMTFRYAEAVIPHTKNEKINEILAEVNRKLKFKFTKL